MKREYIIDACSGQAIEARAGQHITVVDLQGGQVVDFFAVSANTPGEFLSPGVTMDCNGSLKLQMGDSLYTNLYRPMFRILRDDVGQHDLLHPCCRTEMYDFFYGNGQDHPNCLDNINCSLGENRPIIQPVNLFMHSIIHPDGRVTVAPPVSRAGDSITLTAQMDVRLGIAACSVSESQCNSGRCTPIRVVVEG